MKRILLIALVAISFTAFAQKKEVDQIKMIQEIQQWKKDSSSMSFTFWIPNSYWRIALKDKPGIGEPVIKQIEDLFTDYVIVCAADIKIGAFGAITSKPDSILRQEIKVQDVKGKEYLPLQPSELTSELTMMLAQMKPMFAQMLGQFGSGLHFYVFQAKEGKHNIFNEYDEGYFAVNHSDEKFEWTLPLVCFLEDKFCNKDASKILPGNYKFCPFHGEELK